MIFSVYKGYHCAAVLNSGITVHIYQFGSPFFGRSLHNLVYPSGP